MCCGFRRIGRAEASGVFCNVEKIGQIASTVREPPKRFMATLVLHQEELILPPQHF
jgi:hypothetical protein